MHGAVDGFSLNAISFNPIVHSLAILFILGFCSFAVPAADQVKILAPDAVVIVVPAGAPHFSACKDDVAVVQESGIGPTGITMTGK